MKPTNALWDSDTWSILLKQYFNVTASQNFINCGNKQLSQFFEETIGVGPAWPTQLHWDNYSGFVFNYEKGETSKLSAMLSIKNGRFDIFIFWKSKSGRIYDMADEDIDCDDLIFWFEGLDKETYWATVKPVINWHRLLFSPIFIEMHKIIWDVDFSIPFLECMNTQLLAEFEEKTGIIINKSNNAKLVALPKVDPGTFEISDGWIKTIRQQRSIGLYSHLNDEAFETFILQIKPRTYFPAFEYQKDTISTINVSLIVTTDNQTRPRLIKWQSKSGKIYGIADEDIDCNDIEFWFDNLNVEEVYKALYPKINTPFKLKNLNYELKVYSMNLNALIRMHLKPECLTEVDSFRVKIDDFIVQINENTVKKDSKYAVLHDWESKIDDGFLDYNLKIGDHGVSFLKKLFKFLSDLNCFDEVVMS